MSKKDVVRVSAVLIVKNEEKKLPGCLESLSWADEIIVLDSGSSDRTVEIAKSFGAIVAVRKDWLGFGVQRTRAIELARGEWIFIIDADERVSPELKENILKTIDTDIHGVYEVNRLTYCFGRFMRHSHLYPDWIPRLYPKGLACFDETRVHERLRNPKNSFVYRLQGDLLHYGYDSVHAVTKKASHYAKEWAMERAEKGHKGSMVSACVRSLWCFLRMYILSAGFLDGKQGLLMSVMMSYATFLKYADLWVHTSVNPKSEKDNYHA